MQGLKTGQDYKLLLGLTSRDQVFGIIQAGLGDPCRNGVANDVNGQSDHREEGRGERAQEPSGSHDRRAALQ